MRERKCRAKDVRNIGERKKWGWELQRVDDFSSSIVVNLALSLYNQIVSPMDVDDLPNHVKYCVSVVSLQWATIRTSLVRTSLVRIPYTC